MEMDVTSIILQKYEYSVPFQVIFIIKYTQIQILMTAKEYNISKFRS